MQYENCSMNPHRHYQLANSAAYIGHPKLEVWAVVGRLTALTLTVYAKRAYKKYRAHKPDGDSAIVYD